MGTELDGRLLAMRQALAIAIALSPQLPASHRHGALELLNDLKASLVRHARDSPFETPEWVAGAHDELDGIARLVRAFTQTPEPGADAQ